MKRTGRITLCAMLAALASLFMLTSYFPYLTYAIPALAGLFIMVAVIEIDVKWAILAYAASAVITALVAEPEAKMLYVLFFGYYPVVKAVFEKLKSRVAEYIFKFAVFNAATVFAYGVVATLIGVDISDMGDFGKYSALVLLIAANVVFVVYDLAVTKMAAFYIIRLHPQISKIFKVK
ncbi:MAG: DUF2232 domain-containing protein [Clostridia bacterium]|nr:DUF2232 domain-containing protein [Clostridia bacterium]